MRDVRFTQDCDAYLGGVVYELEDGVADAYVAWRCVAEYAEAPALAPAATETKALDGPPADKAMHAGRAGLRRKGVEA